MSEQNIEVVRRTVDGWNRNDLEVVLETLDPDVEFHTSGVFPDFDPVYRGREGFAAFWRAIHEPWKELRLNIEQIEHRADCVVLEFRFRATGSGSGAHVDLKFANAITLRDGLQTKIVARRVFEDARKVAGLSD
jgi:ketosteroid isomerase-like protein